MRAAALFATVLLAGCPIEPPDAAPIGRDASVARDAGSKASDAGPRRCDLFETCPAGLYCSGEGVCVTPGGACSGAEECGDLELCAGGRCVRPEGRCHADDECSGHRCLPSGWCAPYARLQGDALAARCSSRAECGVLGVCRGGVCSACRSDVDCGSSYVCGLDGQCREPFVCQARPDCAPGNACVDGQCTPSRSGCVEDNANDTPSGAVPLTNGATLGASLCGDDVDYYSYEIPAGRGARVIARTDVRRSEAEVDISGAEVAAELTLPGITILEVNTASAARALRIAVRTKTTAGRYSLVVTDIDCAGDALDVYDDTRPNEAPALGATASLHRRICPGDVDPYAATAARGDQLRLETTPSARGAISTRVLSPAGTIARARAADGIPTTLEPSAPAEDEAWTVEVAADSVPPEGTSYALELERLRGVRRDACAAAPELSLSSARVTLGPDVDGPACAPFPARGAFDRVLRLPPQRAGALLHLTARPTSTASRARVGLALLSECTDDLSARVCAFAPEPGGASSLERVLGEAAAWVVVSSTTAGEVELHATLDEVGDYSCRLGGPRAIVSSGALPVDTRAATNTVESLGAACGLSAGDGAGADRFFSLSLGAGERAVLELEGPSGGLLWVGTSCADMDGSCAGAAESSPGSPGRVVLRPDTATNYVVAVDGLSADDEGQYVLHSLFRPGCIEDSDCTVMGERCDAYVCRAPPASDACDGELLTLVDGHATIEGSTGAANDDLVSDRCRGPDGAADVVYAVDVPEGALELSARITRATWDPVLSVRFAECRAAPAELACDDDSGGSLLPLLRLTAPRPGRYYLVVDGYVGGGPFTLEVDVRR